MTHFRSLSYMKVIFFATAASGLALINASAPAWAQESTAKSQPVTTINIPAQNLSDALLALGRATNVQIAFLPDRVANRKSKAVRGTFTVDQALARMLAGTGLRVVRMPDGGYVVGGPTEASMRSARQLVQSINASDGYIDGQANVPEILVRGSRNFTLNLDLPRSENEAQPYTVFTAEQIRHSGAINLENFFRDYLSSNTSVRTSDAGGTNSSRDSQINLRGLGIDSTLILVDGRRIAQPNTGSIGTFTQSSVMGIPLEQIERIEVLSSSAAGQYGSNAVGGVINIILRRDFHGVDVSGYLGGATDGKALEKRLSVNGTTGILPNTSLTISANWQQRDPLYARDRDFIDDRVEFLKNANPNYFETTSTSTSIYGTTPNIRSSDNKSLVLDPEYAVNGVTNLGSNITSLPSGYRGVALDGAAALLANAGSFNLNPGPGISNGLIPSDHVPLLGARKTWGGSATIRSDPLSWLGVYGSYTYSKVVSESDALTVPDSVELPKDSPFNPFTTKIIVTYPVLNATSHVQSTIVNNQALGGVIIKLPYKWQANFDVSTSWATARSTVSEKQLSSSFYNDLTQTGLVNVVRDTLAYPIDWQYDPDHFAFRTPSKSSSTTYTLKLAGSLPFLKLPGGEPVLTVVGERRRQWLGDSVSVTDGPLTSNVNFTPARTETVNSAFSELVLPLVGKENHVPLMQGFELRLSGRYDAYSGVGANANIYCISSQPGTLTDEQLAAPCPAPGQTITFAQTSNDSFNPVIAARWTVTPDITLRGSYSSGYTPPLLNNLVETPGLSLPIPGFESVIPIMVRDPLRGNSPIGENLFGIPLVNGVTGGNPEIDPQKSKSWSFGAILTPRVIDGLTLRADWTQITIRNAYFSPQSVFIGTTEAGQRAFNDFMAAYPDRFTRAPVEADSAYSVGPIIFVDGRTANLSITRTEAIDFSLDYKKKIGSGTLSMTGNATLMTRLQSQLTPSSPLRDLKGVVSVSNIGGTGDSLPFRGTLSAYYQLSNWGAGVRARHYSGYWLNEQHAVDPLQGSARIPGQTQFDVFADFKVLVDARLSLSINNVLNKRAPIDVTRSIGYAPYGDPRLRSFAISLTQHF